MISKLTKLIRETHQRIPPLTQTQKFELRYGEDYRQVMMAEYNPMQKELETMNRLYCKITHWDSDKK